MLYVKLLLTSMGRNSMYFSQGERDDEKPRGINADVGTQI